MGRQNTLLDADIFKNTGNEPLWVKKRKDAFLGYCGDTLVDTE